jgi:hypothetical protein
MVTPIDDLIDDPPIDGTILYIDTHVVTVGTRTQHFYPHLLVSQCSHSLTKYPHTGES